MKKKEAFENLNLLSVEESSSMPKYMQIVNVVLSDIENGIFKAGEMIPSINETSSEFYISRDTVEKAYKKLKEIGIIGSVRGKGYYVTTSSPGQGKKVMVVTEHFGNETRYLFDKLKQTFTKSGGVEIYFHAGNPELLKKSIQNHIGLYDYYIVLSNPQNHSFEMREAVGIIPASKLIYIQKSADLNREVFAVFEYDETQLRNKLNELADVFNRYKRIHVGVPGNTVFGTLYDGVLNYFLDNGIQFELIPDIVDMDVREGDLYITGCDEELYAVLNETTSKKFIPGQDVGVIGLTDSPLIEFIGGGITVISADYLQICRGVASVVQGKIKETVGVGYTIVRRASA